MSHHLLSALATVAALLVSATPTLAQPTEPTDSKPTDSNPWASTPEAAPAPQDSPHSFYAPGNFGYDGGFFIEDASGNFRLEPSAFAQFRYVFTHRASGPGIDSDRSGFEFRRLKFKLKGHVFSPDLEYTLGTSFERNDGVNEISDAFFDWHTTEHVTLRAGRFRPPLLREEIVSAKRQLLVERSLIRSAFGRDRRTGLSATLHNDDASLQVALQNAGNDQFGDGEWLAGARAEFVLAGKAKQFKDFSSGRDDDFAALLGFSALYESDDPSGTGSDAFDLCQWSADLSVEGRGVNTFLALVGNHTDPNAGRSADQLGVVIQGGWRAWENTELLARYVWGDADHLGPDLSVVSVGLNHYLQGQDLKLTFDVGYALSEVGDFWSSSGAGYLTDAPGETGQVVVRSQLQIVF